MAEWVFWYHEEFIPDHRLVFHLSIQPTLECSDRVDKGLTRFMALLWWELGHSSLMRYILGSDYLDDIVALLTDSFSRVMNVLVPLKRVCQYSRA